MKRAFRLAPFALLAAVGCATLRASPDEAIIQSIHDRSREKELLVEKLKRDILKVDRTLAVTRSLIVKSKAAPYLPDLFFRLAELYVEKSRYEYLLQAEQSGSSARTSSMIAPEVRLLKGKVLEIYHRILDEFPDYRDSDKVRFFIAHENRELGRFPEMLAAYTELIEKDPKSPLVDQALYIVGDYWFDKGDQGRAEGYYQRLLDRPKSEARQLALYKLGWIRLFQKNLRESFKYFELAVRAAPPAGSDKALDVRREALTELVFTYTEVKPPAEAIAYFEALADDSDMLVFILGKLANRYWIKQDWASAAPVYRRLLELNEDAEKDPDRAERLYDCIRNGKGKVIPRGADVAALVRVAARGRVDFRATAEDRRQLGHDFEIYARDLSTRLQIAAQRAQDPRLEAEAAKAYAAYLSLFRIPEELRAMRKNYAEALFASGGFVEAGRQYELLAKSAPASAPMREDLLYSSILSYFTALGAKDQLSLYDTVFARSGIEQLGSVYVRGYPRNPRAAIVKFNVAKAYYDEGEFKRSGELFTAYVAEYPTTKEAQISANLALDSYHDLGDYERLIKVAKGFAQNRALPAPLVAQLEAIASHSQGEEIDELALRAGEATGDIASGLVAFAVDQKGSAVGEMALNTAFATYRDKHDVAKMKDVAFKFLAEYPKSKLAANELLSLGKLSADSADYEDAIQAYDEFARRFQDAPQTVDALATAAKLRLFLGDRARGVAELEKALAVAPPARRPELGDRIAEAKLEDGDLVGAQAAASQVLASDPADAPAAVVLGRALLGENRLSEARDRLAQAAVALQRASRGGSADTLAAGKVFFLLGEALYREFAALPKEALEKKAAMVDTLTQAFTGAAQLGSGDDAVGGLYHIGMVYQELGADLTATPEPPGLTPDQKIQFQNQVEAQAGPLKAQADEAFTTCLRKARDLGIVSAFTAGCRSHRAVSREAVVPGYPSGRIDAGKIEELRGRLLKNGDDLEALRGLADAYLAGGDAHRARLVLSRLLELADGDARAETLLGVALWRLGKAPDASFAFHKALELEPDNSKAKANLAAMLCRFGDTEGAHELMASLKPPPVAAFDVDAGGLKCE